MRPTRAAAALVALSVVLTSAALGTTRPAQAAGSTDPGAVTLTKSVDRVHLQPDGTETVADQRTITLKVSQTRDLHSRQPIQVSWSGAKPTQGTIADPNSPDAAQQEYPFLLIECRGLDSASAPAAERLSPETCWTGTTRERVLQDRETGFGPWRLDRYETAVDRQAYVGIPDPFPKQCLASHALGERWLHFRSVKGVDYASDGAGCPSAPPESVVVDTASQPANTTYGTTHLDGEGSASFTTWTSEDNASLGCGPSVPCSLVAVPVEGVSCDAAATSLPEADRPTAGKQLTAVEQACESTGNLTPGAARTGGTQAPAVSGQLWFTASNWRNRITVPLGFAPLSNVCDTASKRTGVNVYGSEVLTQLTTQWRPSFCLNPAKTPFVHVQIGEPQAANLLTTGNVDAAFISDPPATGFSTPTVLAPVSLSGFAISFAMDDADHNPVTHLKLDARLVAKLMTESYPGIPAIKEADSALAHNPLDLSQDPEFKALNPGMATASDSATASTLLDLSSDSDVVEALTSYLAADPEAKDWLFGVPDPWGMVVNPAYTTNPRHSGHLTLPVDNWPLRDTFEPTAYYANANDCLKNAPVPILPLIAAPTARLANISLALQFANTSAQLICNQPDPASSNGEKLVTAGRESPGFRFVLGVTSLGDAARYGLSTASLQTHVDADAAEVPTDAKGRTFVTASAASLTAAAKLLTPDATAGTWTLPYDKVVGDTATTGAYPGAMLLSLAAPTKGLDGPTATGVSQLMTFAAGPGQVAGLGVGQVPPGYLPLTAAYGLGDERAFTTRAAAAVLAQKGASVPMTAPAPPAATGTAPAPPVTGTAVAPPLSPINPTAEPTGKAAVPGPAVASPAPTQLLAPVASLGRTPAATTGLSANLFPLLLVCGLVGAASVVVIRRAARSRP